ncbi:MAG: prepilin peptidase [Bacillota bacterium]|nr:prepilin peptidase [Bacillota bacterium]
MLLLAFVFIGALFGYLSLILSKKLISRRTSKDYNALIISSRFSYIFWIAAFAVSFVLIGLVLNMNFLRCFEAQLLFSVLICLSVIDYLIRKIPNSLLIALLALRIIYICIDKDFGLFISSIIVMVAVFIIFQIPSLFGVHIGMGDIKLAAVIGFFAGFSGIIITAIVMIVLLLLYTIYLYISKKGSLKSHVALGPFLSTGGFVAFIIFSLSANAIPLFFNLRII